MMSFSFKKPDFSGTRFDGTVSAQRRIAKRFAPLVLMGYVTSALVTPIASNAMLSPLAPVLKGYTRSLTAKEMSNIVGSTHALSVSAASGPSYPFEGSVGGTNTGNGNKMTNLPIVGWTAKGGLPIDVSLIHNSQGNHNSELGQKWTWSYDWYIIVDNPNNVVYVHHGNDLAATFGKNIDLSYNCPVTLREKLVANYTAGVITSFDLTFANQIKYHFTNPNNTSFYPTTITDRNGNVTTINHNASDLVTSVVDPTSRTVTFGYTSGLLTTITDPQSRVWTISYTSGKLTKVSWPAVGGSTYTDQFSYDANNNITTHTDRRGHNWTATFNSDSSIATETDAASNTTSYDYYSGYTIVTDPNSHTFRHNYNGNGQLSSALDNDSRTVTNAYDGNYNKTSVTDQLSKVWTYTYDASGNVLTAVDPNSHTTTYTYNATNDVLTVTTPIGNQIVNTYDGSGNLTQTQHKNPSATAVSTDTYSYNGNGTLASKTDDNSHTISYGYNTNGHLTSETTALSKVTSWTVNGLGARTGRTDARGRTTSYTLDNWNRVTTTTYPAGTNPTFSYDANSNLTGWTDSWGTWARTYDNDNRMLTESKGGSTEITYAYDGTGQKGLLSTVTDVASRTITYAYTTRNQLYTASESSNTATYSYDYAGRETGVTNENGTTVANVYDDAGRLTSVTNKTGGGTTLSSFSYGYTNDDQKSSLTEADGSVVSYGYDAMHRLTSESRTTTNPYSYSYGLDGKSNRTSKVVSGTTTTYTNDNDDRVTAVGTDSYSYNDNGETTSKTVGGTTYGFSYTYEGMIDYYNVGGGNQVDFGYDAIGRRIYRTKSGTTTRYYFDGNKVLRESQAGTITATYAYGNGLLRKDSEYPLFDGMGHERTVTNSSQTVTGTVNYDAFGNTVGSTGSSGNSYMYGANSGYRSDGDAGLSYVAARYYDSKIGRFTTRDSYLDQNPYVYCDGDPVNCLDPSGHDWRTRLRQIGGAIAGKVVGTIIIAGGLLLLPVEAPALIVIGVVIGGGALGGYIGAKIGGFDPTSGAVVGGLTSGLPFLAIPTMLIGPLDILE